MVSSWKRIAIATIVSLFGCALTYWWHLKNEPKSQSDSEADVIAYIAATKHEIHRKGSNNALWEPAEELDRLRTGDSVRTSGNSEARIQFYKSNRYVDLEADSMIVIQKLESEISLELLEGSLFVNGVDKNNKNALTLKSQGGKVDLSKAATQLSGSSNAKMELKVLKGSAQYLKEGAKSESITEGSEGGIGTTGLRVSAEKVRILSPDTTKPLYINAISPEPVMIQWSGLPPDAQVQLETGSSRKQIVPTSSEKLSKNQVQVLWKPGIYYWKLKAMDPDTRNPMGESPIYKTEIIGRYPPTPVSPEPNFIIQTRKSAETITLRWSTPQDYTEVLVELQNETTKQKLVNKRFPTSVDFHDVPNLPLGSYSWKLTAFPIDKTKPLAGPTHQFFINEKRIIKIPITWNANLQSTQYFVNTDPKLTLMWDPDTSDRVKKWKVHVAPEGPPLLKGESSDTRQIKFEKVLAKVGRFIASVEAYDDEGDLIGNSEVRTFDVAVLPLLPAPSLTPNDNSEFLARPDGSLGIKWDTLSGAKDYQILVRDNSGKIISEYSSDSPTYKLTNLMPGSYSVQVGATDTYGRRGELSMKRSLIVPDKSEVKAPKLKKIKVN